MELVEPDGPHPVRVIGLLGQGSRRGPDVPETGVSIVPRGDEMVLLVGVEVQAADHVVAGVLQVPALVEKWLATATPV